jgi:PII-like signaling protein
MSLTPTWSPELDNKFRTNHGRKIFGVKYKGEIHAVMCFAYTNDIPKSVEELDKPNKVNKIIEEFLNN